MNLKVLVLISTCLLATSVRSTFAQCRFAPAHAGRTLTFSFVPDKTVSGLVLHIVEQFQGNASGSEEIQIPVAWAGARLHAISNLRATSASTTIEDGAEPGTKTIRYPPNATVELSYDLTKDWSGPLVSPLQFHPVVMPDYFEITGNNSLLFPKIETGGLVTAHFDFHGLPNDWALATSFGTPEDRRGYCQSASGSREDILSRALFAAGDFRIHRFQIGRRPAVLAVRGLWTFTDEQAVAQIQKVVGLVRDFWHDDNFPYFLVTLTPYDQDHGSTDGSAFTNAFWMYVSRLDSAMPLPTLAHEAFHAWDLGKMGPYDSYASFNWFHEGFTQYYAYKLVYRAGLMPLSAYVESLNRDLRRYPDTDDPYIRGRGIALWLDGEIRAQSRGQKSLDNVMFDMVAEAAKPITRERILETADRYLSPAAQQQLESAANHGTILLPAADAALAGCSALSVSLEQVPVFDLGFDLQGSRQSGHLIGIRDDGPAYSAGLRDGQVPTRTSVHTGDPDALVTVSVEIDGQPKVIQYYPRGKVVSAAQYHLDSAVLSAHPHSCIAR